MGDAGRGGTGEEGSTFLTRAPAPPTGEMWRADAATASSRQSPVMPRRLRPLPDSLRWNVFTTAEARAAGVSGGRLQAGDVIRIGRGLYARSEMPADATDASVDQSGSAPGQAGIHDRRYTSGHLVHDPTTDREGPPPSSADPSDDGVHAVREADVIRALQRADPDAVACGLSAARLWRLPLPRGLTSWDAGAPVAQVEMSRPGIHRLSRGLVAWRSFDLAPADVSRVSGVGATSRLRTFLDLADVLAQDDLVVIGDHLVRIPRPSVEGRSRPFVELSLLTEAVGSFSGRGARRLRAALADVRVGADSPPETALRLALQRAGLPDPLLNATIRQDGQWLGDPDMAWRDWKVCVEYDGRHHRTQAQQAKDVRRGERRRLAGWTELIVTAEDMAHDASQAVDRVRAELRRQGMTG